MTTKDQERKALGQIREIVEGLQDAIYELSDKAIETWNMFRAEEDKRIAAEEQIVRLKGKLYDMMIEKEEQ